MVKSNFFNYKPNEHLSNFQESSVASNLQVGSVDGISGAVTHHVDITNVSVHAIILTHPVLTVVASQTV